MNICVYGAASNDIDKSFIVAAQKLGEEIASRKHTLVFGGGATGMMGAVACGCKKQNGDFIGIAPRFFDTDGILCKDCSHFIFTDTMRQRKSLMEEKSDAFVVTPGGIGTLEEFLEILTLRSLNRHKKPIAVLNTNSYFDNLLAFLHNSVDKNFLRQEDIELFFVSDDQKAVLDYLENYR